MRQLGAKSRHGLARSNDLRYAGRPTLTNRLVYPAVILSSPWVVVADPAGSELSAPSAGLGFLAYGVVIFLHIPKTAGTTLSMILARQYDPSATFGPLPYGGDEARVLVREIETGESANDPNLADANRLPIRRLGALGQDRLRRLQLVQGHFAFGVHVVLPQPSTYVTIMRRPPERVLSLYHHRVEHQGLRLSLERYVREAHDREMDNLQTRLVAGGPPYVSMPDALELAKQNLLDRFRLVGLTERFDETLMLLARTFHWGTHRLLYLPRMVGTRRLGADEIPAHILKAIEEYNRYDAELYRFAEVLFEEKLAVQNPPIDRELARFRKRNSAFKAEKQRSRLRRRKLTHRVARHLTKRLISTAKRHRMGAMVGRLSSVVRRNVVR